MNINTVNRDKIGEIALPFSQNEFAAFITSLLGKPQTISKTIVGNFTIGFDELGSLYELLNQRIFQQNDSRLIQFTATIYYSDNSSITLNGFEHLVHYNQTNPLVSQAIHLTWQYLVKFRDKESYEKQEINVSFLTPSDNLFTKIDNEEEHLDYFYTGRVKIRIAHTARTWGADIEALLTKNIQNIVVPESKWKSFLRFNQEECIKVVSIFILFLSLIGMVFSTTEIRINTISIEESISLLMDVGFFLMGTYLFAEILKFILENIEIFSPPSYLLLTKSSFDDKSKQEKLSERSWLKFILTMITGITCGIVGNYVFYLIMNN